MVQFLWPIYENQRRRSFLELFICGKVLADIVFGKAIHYERKFKRVNRKKVSRHARNRDFVAEGGTSAIIVLKEGTNHSSAVDIVNDVPESTAEGWGENAVGAVESCGENNVSSVQCCSETRASGVGSNAL
ncbi:hypothetical protein RJ641_008181 [Dillenia turbinata]|uniref:Uncharacterized protein n=1 Tax=Dillenia turbinata TaxID=194707 RepID=A0AAN8Z673_9MAGN